MSQENVEIVHQLTDAWSRQDIDTVLALTDPEVEYVNAPGAVEPGTRRGHVALAAVAQTQWDLPDARWEVDRVHDRGDLIIVEGRISRTMPGSDARIGDPVLTSITFREGKVTGIEVLGVGSEVQSAREAVGLSE